MSMNRVQKKLEDQTALPGAGADIHLERSNGILGTMDGLRPNWKISLMAADVQPTDKESSGIVPPNYLFQGYYPQVV